ncbi:hypothetical protein FMEXI_11322 [Fusarium mexicanum]|uniref:Uncharacterized protein n=1 Tax=Fusarium mexicanum TaxID=751941 RepID=A0A8H5IH79_9HYPO|nr:hypothetical protein FMEXI_11322 [Fusarium mexicanum]
MHIVRQNDLKIRNGVTVNETGQGQSSSPLRPRSEKLLWCRWVQAVARQKMTDVWKVNDSQRSRYAPQRTPAQPTYDLYFIRRRMNTPRLAPEVPDLHTDSFLLARAKYNQEKARDLRAQAENLEEWGKKDTKEAARHNIDGAKLAAKEGGPSSIDDLFEKTRLEMEMEAEEAENADPAENVGSEFYSRDGSVCVIQLYTRTNTAVILITFQGQVMKRERGFDYSCIPQACTLYSELERSGENILAVPPPSASFQPIEPVTDIPDRWLPRRPTSRPAGPENLNPRGTSLRRPRYAPSLLPQTTTDLTHPFSFIRYRLYDSNTDHTLAVSKRRTFDPLSTDATPRPR